MNAKMKSNNGWILCPSNSFPGKFYYFNVLTGETAWRSETDKNPFRNDTNMPKTHSYPEPEHPPDFESPSTSSYVGFNYQPCVSPKQTIYNQPKYISPTFGQVMFPKYMPNMQYMPNMVWAPIPVPSPQTYLPMAPMFTPNQFKCRKTSEQGTQTSRNIFVTRPTSPVFKINKINFNPPPTKPLLSPNYANTPDNYLNINSSTGHVFGKKQNVFNTQFPKNPFQKPINSSLLFEEPCTKKPRLMSEDTIITNIFFNTQKPKTQFKNSPTLLPENNDINIQENLKRKCNNGENNTKEGIPNLECNDLRYLLVAKRRKLVEPTPINPKITTKEDREMSYKKKVSFDLLSEISSEEHFSVNSDVYIHPQTVDLKYLAQLANTNMRTDCWYILPDIDVLFNDFDFILQFVQSDASCRIYIPYTTYKATELQSLGDCRGRPRAMDARHLLRNISNCGATVVVQDSEDNRIESKVTEDILNCCILLQQQKHHCVIITKDGNLNTKARCLNLHSFKLSEIVNRQESTEPTFEIRKTNSVANENYKLSDPNIPKKYFSQNETPKSLNKQSIFEKSEHRQQENNENLFTQYINQNKISNNHEIVNRQESTEPTFEIRKTNSVANENYKLSDPNIPKKYFSQNETPKSLNKQSIFEKSEHRQQENNENLFTQYINQNKISNNQESMKNKIQHENNSTLFADIGNKIQKISLTDYKIPKKNASNQHKVIDSFPHLKQKNSLVENTNLEYNVTSPLEIDEKGRISNGYSMEDALRRFYVRSQVIEERVRNRMDEWECTLTQIMEDALTEVLQDNWKTVNKKLPPPWSLHEATEYIKRFHASNHPVKAIADRLSVLLTNHCYAHGPNGKIQKLVKPNDFMQVFGCCLLLIQALQTVYPTSKTLSTSEESLLNLLKLMEDPTMDLDLKLPANTSIAYRSEDETDKNLPRNCSNIKNPVEILDYLSEHYPQWRNYNTDVHEINQETNKSPKKNIEVIRTIGKDLNMIKITNENIITVNDTNNDNCFKPSCKTRIIGNKVIKDKTNINNQEKANTNIDFDITKHENTFITNNNFKTNGPKVIRNVNVIEEFEKKFQSKLDMDYSDDKESNDESKELVDSKNSKEMDFKDDDELFDEDDELMEDDDSGIENEEMVYSSVKDFLLILSRFLKMLHNFIYNSISELCKSNLEEDQKTRLHRLSNEMYSLVDVIIDRLKSIIKRESSATSDRSVLVKAGLDAHRYRRIVSKCLKQTEVLQQFLKVLTSNGVDHFKNL